MANPEQLREPDIRLVDPDKYFLDKYGDVEVIYGGHELTLRASIQFEQLARKPEDIQNDSKTRRASVFINMLREAGALEPLDDITYTELT